jgi:glycosyltransferase involved in cell wall biosynthesis
MTPPALSLVIPVFNEVDNLPVLHAEITAALAPLGRPYEVLYVDDGSTDGSLAVLERLAAADPAVLVVRLLRNQGQSPASAGCAARSP